jgi:DNA (cytosine-5)-methyltransferase 1
MGFNARWGVLGAADVGANHQRDRIWIVAKWRGQLPHAQHDRIRRWEQQQEGAKEEKTKFSYSNSIGLHEQKQPIRIEKKNNNTCNDGGSQFLANTNSAHGEGNQCTKRTQQKHANLDSTSQLADTQNEGYVRWLWSMGATQSEYQHRRSQSNGGGEWWQVEPNVGRVADGVAARVDRLKAIGNGQVPLCAATAWRILNDL